MKKIYVSWNDIQRQTQELVRQMWLDQWVPDYIVGITRGGLTPAVLISQYLDRPMYTLKVSLQQQTPDCESHVWMSEDAFGYHRLDLDSGISQTDLSNSALRKNILIVDDINDQGSTLNWIKNDWQTNCLPANPDWKDVWNSNVRIAVLYHNEASHSEIDPDYYAESINKIEDPSWVVFPWEEWWRRWNPNEQHKEMT